MKKKDMWGVKKKKNPFVTSLKALEIKLRNLNQKILKAERLKLRMMDILSLSSSIKRRARTRSLIQLGGLIEKAELLEKFGIALGEDLQKSPHMKEPVAALFKGLLVLGEMVNKNDVDLRLWAQQGLQVFKEKNISDERPLDKEKRNFEDHQK